MATILQTTFSDALLWMKSSREKFGILIEYLDWNFTEVAPKGPIDNIPALI